MAGWSLLLHQQKKRVAVAIEPAFDEALAMARRLAFSPKRLTRARPVANLPCRKRLRERRSVHPSHHEHLTRVVLLGDGWHEALIIELYGVDES
jgi:hypothetical protein